MVPYTVDFETHGIEARPVYPPVPVGVSVWAPGKKPVYYAWGHPTKNNCTKEKAYEVLRDIWRSGKEILFHNAKFDLDVAREHFGLALPPWHLVHDTLFLLFLNDPHAPSLSLKPSAERILGMPPDERDAVKEWLVAHGIVPSNAGPRLVGPNIWRAPGDIVGRYAKGDVLRTRKLFDLLLPKLDAGERRAYDRERRLLPILLNNEAQGLRVDVDRLAVDLGRYESALVTVEEWLREQMQTPGLDFDKDTEVADALDRCGAVTEWVLTPKSKKRSTSKKNIRITNREIAQALGYRNRLFNVLSQSMRPWLTQAQAKGYIYTEWNQVRQAKGDNDSKGARTGRLSCSRFMNITKDYSDRNDGYVHPSAPAVPELPLVRRYLMPDPGGLWVHRDYNQQEFRILSHYEEGAIYESYLKDPRTDYHVSMQARIEEVTGEHLERRPVKTLNFGLLYGMGVGLLAERGGWTVAKATALRNLVKKAAPDVEELNKDLKKLARRNEPVREWGGGLIYCEKPTTIKEGPRKGATQTYEYKVLNHLVQRSAASCTKEAIIRYHDVKKESRMLVTVHDEVNITAPAGCWQQENALLRSAMESIEFDVPMLTDGKVGTSWGDLKAMEAK